MKKRNYYTDKFEFIYFLLHEIFMCAVTWVLSEREVRFWNKHACGDQPFFNGEYKEANNLNREYCVRTTFGKQSLNISTYNSNTEMYQFKNKLHPVLFKIKI